MKMEKSKEIRRRILEKWLIYIFENVIDAKELEDIKEDLEQLRENFPKDQRQKMQTASAV